MALNQQGDMIGEVTAVAAGALDVTLGGWRDAWGFIDFSSKGHVRVPPGALAFGPPRAVVRTMVVLPTQVGTAVER